MRFMFCLVQALLEFVLHLLQAHRNTAAGIIPFTLLQISPAAVDLSSLKLFLIFLKVGAILYGSGYVL